jgi:hypothetical protein
MLEISRLEPAPCAVDAPPTGTTWGTSQRLLTSGLVTLVLGLGFAAYVLANRPLPPTSGLTPENINRLIQHANPTNCFAIWSDFAKNGIDPGKTSKDAEYEAAYMRFVMVLGLAGIVLVVGGGLAGLGILQRRGTHAPSDTA